MSGQTIAPSFTGDGSFPNPAGPLCTRGQAIERCAPTIDSINGFVRFDRGRRFSVADVDVELAALRADLLKHLGLQDATPSLPARARKTLGRNEGESESKAKRFGSASKPGVSC